MSTHSDQKERWLQVARQALGPVADTPLVDRMLYWIGDGELAAALEDCGLLKSGKGTLISVEQMTHETMEVLKKYL